MPDTVASKNGIIIRLPAERWVHILEEHCELAGLKLEVLETVGSPSRILMGNMGELLAVRDISTKKHLVVVYRELEKDGFIITAFLTTKIETLKRRVQIWPKSQ